jgi:phospholipase A1/A2
MRQATIAAFVVLLLLLDGGATAHGTTKTEHERCLLRVLATAPDDLTVAEVHRLCSETRPAPQDETTGVVAQRLRAEEEMERSPWSITPHKPSYVMPVAFNSLGSEPIGARDGDADSFQDLEVKFQISLKFPVVQNLYDDRAGLYFAYTNQSWWQLYAADQPFRETNHEPEMFLRIRNDVELLGLRNKVIDLGFVHQSNGRSGSLSRAWNRLYANFVFERGDFAVGVKPWLIVDDSENPDIDEFLGYGEVRAGYVRGPNSFSALVRNNLDFDDNKGAIELTWSRALSGVLRLYAQYYYGYGESLLDYNARVNRVGLGISINDYLLR